MMSTNGMIIKLVVVALLLLVCNALADFHGDCHDDCEGRPCCHTCTHAIMSETFAVSIVLNPNSCPSHHSLRMPYFYPDNIFLPPR